MLVGRFDSSPRRSPSSTYNLGKEKSAAKQSGGAANSSRAGSSRAKITRPPVPFVVVDTLAVFGVPPSAFIFYYSFEQHASG